MDVAEFKVLLSRWSMELFEDNRDLMISGGLLPTKNVIDAGDVALFGHGLDEQIVEIFRGGRFNTVDRPKSGGRWSLLSRSKAGGWYNAEYLPQLAAYVDAIRGRGFSPRRTMFELPTAFLQLDLAVFDDSGRVVVLGEAKRDTQMLAKLVYGLHERFGRSEPTADSKKRGDEVRQLAWRLWTTRAPFLWLIGPGDRRAFACTYEPLRLTPLPELPRARDIGLAHEPAGAIAPKMFG